jgi:hypothetical protein
VAWLCGVRVVALCGMVVHGARGGAVWPWVRVVALCGMVVRGARGGAVRHG